MKKIDWKTEVIPIGKTHLQAQVADFVDQNLADSFLRLRWRRTVNAGGALFLRIKKPPLVEFRIPSMKRIFRRYEDPLIGQIWKIPKCSFEQLLLVPRHFGFPSQEVSHGSDRVFSEVLALLTNLSRSKALAITRIDESFVLVELTTRSQSLSRSEAKSLAEFNKTHFRVRYSLDEEADMLANWIERSFFTIGAV